jgi:excisionase family DNA binding protein
MEDKLLSIGEAARLMGVCENTLRDWDIEDKFKATRTGGGHRRYSLEQVREYLDKNPPEEEKPDALPLQNQVVELVKRWEKTEYLHGIKEKTQRQAFAVILENIRLYNECQIDPLFSTGQTLWLARESWSRLKFKNMVSIQPLLGPCGLVYFTKETKQNICIDSDAIAAKTLKMSFSVFERAPFDQIKDTYADAIASEIDFHIFQNLPGFNAEPLLDATASSCVPMRQLYDYIIAPNYMIEILKTRESLAGVDLFGISTVLDPESFTPMAAGGKYPVSNLATPIFAPYILFLVGPTLLGGTGRSMMMRSGWYSGSRKEA